jgi:transcriptional regulator with XRE-family HTH domain
LIFASISLEILRKLDININMLTLQELGEAVAHRRKTLRQRQSAVAVQAGITPETLSRFEQGRVPEFGARKLLAVLAVLGMEIQFVEKGMAGSLDELRKERGA